MRAYEKYFETIFEIPATMKKLGVCPSALGLEDACTTKYTNYAHAGELCKECWKQALEQELDP